MAKIVLGRWELGRRMCKDSIKYVGFVRLAMCRAVYELGFWSRDVSRTFSDGAINNLESVMHPFVWSDEVCIFFCPSFGKV